VVLESLASGTPVVATDVGSVSEIVEEGRNGKVVPPRQVEPLAEAIRELLDETPATETVRNSRAVRSWDAVADEVMEVFSHVLVGTEGKKGNHEVGQRISAS
jgi:glycosyltransferase involved in cell wall biosynthesis